MTASTLTKFAVNSAEAATDAPRARESGEAWERSAPRFLSACFMKSPSPFDGVLLIDKESGMTSHDVVAIVRNRLETQKVGHCGTLDPFATGLLLVVVGRGTKIQDLLMSEDQEYEGTIKLGQVTDTQDRDGVIIDSHEVGTLDKSAIVAAFAKFHG